MLKFCYLKDTLDILKHYMKGRQALQDLEKTHDIVIKEKLRGYVIASIVDYAYEKRFKYTRQQIEQFASDIKNIFPNEDPKYYFIAAKPSIMKENMKLQKFSPQGKLYDAYNYSIKGDMYHKGKDKEKDNDVIDEEDIQQPRSKNVIVEKYLFF